MNCRDVWVVVLASFFVIESIALQPPPDPFPPVIVKPTTFRLRGWCTYFAISADSKRIACMNRDDRVIDIHSLTTGDLEHRIELGKDGVDGCLEFTNQGKEIVVAGQGVYRYDLQTGKRLMSAKWDWIADERKYYDYPPAHPVISKDGKYVIAGGPTYHITIYSTDTGKEVKSFDVDKRPLYLSVAPDSQTVAIGFKDRVKVYSIEKEEVVANIKMHVSSNLGYPVYFAPFTSRLFAFGSNEGYMPRVRDSSAVALVLDVKKQSIANALATGMTPVKSLLEPPDTNYTLVVDSSRISIIDRSSGKLVGRVGAGPVSEISPDGKLLIGSHGYRSESFLITVPVKSILKTLPEK